MYRALLALGLAAPLVVPTVALARSQDGTVPAVSRPSEATHPLVARLGHLFDGPLVPPAIIDHLVRWRMSVRDLFHDAADRLAQLAQDSGLAVADLTVLTIQPLPASNTSWATSGFGWRDDPIHHNSKFHSGADIRAQSGTPVMVAGDGVVQFCGRQGGYGNVIYVDHGGGVITRYAHLRRIETKKDAVLTAGTEIGLVGATGRATGPHLHFEIRIDGHAVDPTTALTVAELQRTSPSAGQLAAYALSPELQAHVLSDLDPPRAGRSKAAKSGKAGSRPDRPGRAKRVRPVS